MGAGVVRLPPQDPEGLLAGRAPLGGRAETTW